MYHFLSFYNIFGGGEEWRNVKIWVGINDKADGMFMFHVKFCVNADSVANPERAFPTNLIFIFVKLFKSILSMEFSSVTMIWLSLFFLLLFSRVGWKNWGGHSDIFSMIFKILRFYDYIILRFKFCFDCVLSKVGVIML